MESGGTESLAHRTPYYPTIGFGEFEAAQRFCQAVDEVGNKATITIVKSRVYIWA